MNPGSDSTKGRTSGSSLRSSASVSRQASCCLAHYPDSRLNAAGLGSILTQLPQLAATRNSRDANGSTAWTLQNEMEG